MQGVHAREMINFLMGCHFGQKIGGDGGVVPFEVPISAVIILHFPAHFLPYSLHHIVLGVGDIEQDGLAIFILRLLFVSIDINIGKLG